MNSKFTVIFLSIFFAICMFVPVMIQSEKKQNLEQNLISSYNLLQYGLNQMMEAEKVQVFSDTELYKILKMPSNDQKKAHIRHELFEQIMREYFEAKSSDLVMYDEYNNQNPGFLLKNGTAVIIVYNQRTNRDNVSIWLDLNASEPPDIDFVDIFALRINKQGKLIFCDTTVENLNYLGLDKRIKKYIGEYE